MEEKPRKEKVRNKESINLGRNKRSHIPGGKGLEKRA